MSKSGWVLWSRNLNFGGWLYLQKQPVNTKLIKNRKLQQVETGVGATVKEQILSNMLRLFLKEFRKNHSAQKSLKDALSGKSFFQLETSKKPKDDPLMKKFQRVAESKQTQLKVKYSKGPLHALRVIFRRILKKNTKKQTKNAMVANS